MAEWAMEEETWENLNRRVDCSGSSGETGFPGESAETELGKSNMAIVELVGLGVWMELVQRENLVKPKGRVNQRETVKRAIKKEPVKMPRRS